MKRFPSDQLNEALPARAAVVVKMAALWQTTWPTEALCSGKLSKAAGGLLKRFVLGGGKTTKRFNSRKGERFVLLA